LTKNAILLIYNVIWVQNFITEINVKIGTLPIGLDFCWVLCKHIHTQLQMFCISAMQEKSEMAWSTSPSHRTNPFRNWHWSNVPVNRSKY